MGLECVEIDIQMDVKNKIKQLEKEEYELSVEFMRVDDEYMMKRLDRIRKRDRSRESKEEVRRLWTERNSLEDRLVALDDCIAEMKLLTCADEYV